MIQIKPKDIFECYPIEWSWFQNMEIDLLADSVSTKSIKNWQYLQFKPIELFGLPKGDMLRADRDKWGIFKSEHIDELIWEKREHTFSQIISKVCELTCFYP